MWQQEKSVTIIRHVPISRKLDLSIDNIPMGVYIEDIQARMLLIM